jgi:hypothetical protein
VSPVKFELGFYIPEDGILLCTDWFLMYSDPTWYKHLLGMYVFWQRIIRFVQVIAIRDIWKRQEQENIRFVTYKVEHIHRTNKLRGLQYPSKIYRLSDSHWSANFIASFCG